MQNANLILAGSIVLTLAMAAPAPAEQASQTEGDAPGPAAPGALGEFGTGSPAPRVTTVDRSVADVTGSEVRNNRGETIGEVDSIVRDRGSEQLFAVVSVGGFLGIGDSNVTIPLKNLELQDRQLVIPVALSEDQLQQWPPYEADLYDEVADDQTVKLTSIAPSASERTAGISPTFRALDTNGDGFLNKQEAARDQRLVRQWDSADSNADARIDQVEFSAFEAHSLQPGGPQTGGSGRDDD